MVENVERFQLELEFAFFTEGDLAIERDIVIDVRGTVHDIHARIALRSDGRHAERSRIEEHSPVRQPGRRSRS